MLKRFLPHSMFGRTFMIFVTPLILLQIITAYIFYDRHWNIINRRMANHLVREITLVITEVQQKTPMEKIKNLARILNLDIQLYTNSHLDLDFKNKNPEELNFIFSQQIEHYLTTPYILDISSHPRDMMIYFQLDQDNVLKIIASKKRLYSSTTYILLAWMVGTSLILGFIATLFMRNQIRPIQRLAVAAEQLGKGRDVPDLKASGADEIRQATVAFRTMRERIKRQIQQRTDMLAGVSHDLRTPLTRLQLQLAMMEENEKTSAMKNDLNEMQKLIDAYLDFARDETIEEPTITSINDLLADVIQKYDINIHMELAKNINLPLRINAMRRCFDNIINNASRYATEINITIKRKDRFVIIMLDDNGPGIPPEKWEDVFKPFYRVEESRNRETGGTGLGLSIAQDIVRTHGGNIKLGTSQQGGLRVIVRLPV